jgi:hypothetical protein
MFRGVPRPAAVTDGLFADKQKSLPGEGGKHEMFALHAERAVGGRGRVPIDQLEHFVGRSLVKPIIPMPEQLDARASAQVAAFPYEYALLLRGAAMRGSLPNGNTHGSNSTSSWRL